MNEKLRSFCVFKAPVNEEIAELAKTNYPFSEIRNPNKSFD
jgi:hypothetical protein